MLKREDCQFQAFFCEENIWQLAKQINDPDKTKIIFISNQSNQFLMMQQLGGVVDPESFSGTPYIIWDYHVILIHKSDDGELCYDLNTCLDFPMSMTSYIEHSFTLDIPLQYWPQFRPLEATYFQTHFSSDRRHMKNDQGKWLQAPPSWDLVNPKKEHNLNEFIDFNSPKHGPVFNLKQMIAQYK